MNLDCILTVTDCPDTSGTQLVLMVLWHLEDTVFIHCFVLCTRRSYWRGLQHNRYLFPQSQRTTQGLEVCAAEPYAKVSLWIRETAGETGWSFRKQLVYNRNSQIWELLLPWPHPLGPGFHLTPHSTAPGSVITSCLLHYLQVTFPKLTYLNGHGKSVPRLTCLLNAKYLAIFWNCSNTVTRPSPKHTTVFTELIRLVYIRAASISQ